LSRKDFLLLALLQVGSVACLGVGLWLGGFVGGRPDLSPPVDASFVPIARAYSEVVLDSYASAWAAAADEVAAGQPVAEALLRIRPNWDAARTPEYKAKVSPAFNAIVPEGTPDAEITPIQRAALAAAFRGFAKGVKP